MKIQSLEKLFVNGVQLDEKQVREMDQQIEKSRFGRVERPRGMDAQDRGEWVKDLKRGRSAGPDSEWRQVMERYGFRWYTGAELDHHLGRQVVIPKSLEGVPDPASLRAQDVPNQSLYFWRAHPEGQWRNDIHQPNLPKSFRLAYAEGDLLGLFLGPESFANWIEEHMKLLRMARIGLVSGR